MPTAMLRKNHKDAATRLSVDFPKQNEIITYPQYTMRVSAPEGVKRVEVTVDRGEWRSCRNSVGHWWYDWSGYDDGEHQVVARIETREGRRITSEPHEFFVNLQPKPVRK